MQNTFTLLNTINHCKSIDEAESYLKTLTPSVIERLISEIKRNEFIHNNHSPISSTIQIRFHKTVLQLIDRLKETFSFPPDIDHYGLEITRTHFEGNEATFVKTKLLSIGSYQLVAEVEAEHSIYVSPMTLETIEFDHGRVILRKGSAEKLKFYFEHILFDWNALKNVKIHRVHLRRQAYSKAS